MQSPQGQTLTFDIIIKTSKGMLYATYLKRTTANEAGMTVAALDTSTSMNIQKAHRMLGHMGEEVTKQTAEALGWTITRGALGVCESCSIAKAR